jgi:hypothetical protein
MLAQINLHRCKWGILVYWAVWLTVVCLTNIVDAMRAAGVVGASVTFASDNYAAIVRTTGVHHLPAWVNLPLLLVAATWEGTSAVLFYRAARRSRRAIDFVAVNAAFGLRLFLWLGFTLVDELFIRYQQEKGHMSVFVFEISTFLAIHLLPEKSGE